MRRLDYGTIKDTLVTWLVERVEQAGADGLLIGLSGGIDSSVTAALARLAFPRNSFGVILPCHSQQTDQEDAMRLADAIGLPYKSVCLDAVYDEMLHAVDPQVPYEDKPLSYSNIKPRLRMTALYFEASLRNYLVAGTGNKSEFVTGYFTKYGDGGVDLEPLGELLKTDVRALAAELGVPESIIEKAPTAGLWTDQTDEDEMGFTYEQLDRYILSGEAKPDIARRIERLNRSSMHKKTPPPICPLGLTYNID